MYECFGQRDFKWGATGVVNVLASLIVAVYERVDVLGLVLASIGRQTERDFETVIADDGSPPAVGALARDWASRTQRPLQHIWHEDQGFRKTTIANRAVASARGRYLIFIDGDCILHHRFVERHLRRCRHGRVLSGRRVMLDEEVTRGLTMADVDSGRIEQPLTWWHHTPPHDRRNGIYLPAAFGWRGGFNPRYEILGSNFSLHRIDFEQVNGFDERISARGLEDVNLRRRLLNAGTTIHSISQEAIQYHCHHPRGPIPHDAEAVRRWSTTEETSVPHGLESVSSRKER